MATAANNLQTAIDNAALAIAEWDLQKVSYSDQGRSEQWTAHYQTLVDALDKLIAMKSKVNGPVMVRSYGRAG